jgi:UrcA family protein
MEKSQADCVQKKAHIQSTKRFLAMKMNPLASWSGIIGFCLFLSSFGASVNAQQEEADVEEILVIAPRVIIDDTERTIIRGGGRVSMSYGVSYADLDLTQPDDRAELEGRVQEAAAQICEILAERFSAGRVTAADCRRQAQSDAMAKVNEVIAAASP